MLLEAGARTHTEPPNITKGGKMPIIFAAADDQTHDPPHANPTLKRVAINAGLYRKAVQVCLIHELIS